MRKRKNMVIGAKSGISDSHTASANREWYDPAHEKPGSIMIVIIGPRSCWALLSVEDAARRFA